MLFLSAHCLLSSLSNFRNIPISRIRYIVEQYCCIYYFFTIPYNGKIVYDQCCRSTCQTLATKVKSLAGKSCHSNIAINSVVDISRHVFFFCARSATFKNRLRISSIMQIKGCAFNFWHISTWTMKLFFIQFILEVWSWKKQAFRKLFCDYLLFFTFVLIA